MAGLMNSLCLAVSMGLQYGVPPEVYVSKLSHMRFEPSGLTNDADIRTAKSIVDYIFRWMATKFLSPEAQYRAGVNMREEPDETEEAKTDAVSGFSRTDTGRTETSRPEPTLTTEAKPRASEFAAMRNQEDAPPCSTCGSIMIRSGSCYKCANCGTTSGCA